MIIEEKGLVKAIKAAYRHSGYTVLNQGGEVTIYTEGWFVRCLWTKLPRKALTIIVEHMGMIPDDGEAMAIEKDDQPQAVMAGIVSDDVAGWMGAIRKTTWAWDWERTVWEAMESVDLHKKEG